MPKKTFIFIFGWILLICGSQAIFGSRFFSGEDGVSIIEVLFLESWKGSTRHSCVGCSVFDSKPFRMIFENGCFHKRFKNGLFQVRVHHLSDRADAKISEFHQEKEK